MPADAKRYPRERGGRPREREASNISARDLRFELSGLTIATSDRARLIRDCHRNGLQILTRKVYRLEMWRFCQSLSRLGRGSGDCPLRDPGRAARLPSAARPRQGLSNAADVALPVGAAICWVLQLCRSQRARSLLSRPSTRRGREGYSFPAAHRARGCGQSAGVKFEMNQRNAWPAKCGGCPGP